MSLLDKIKNGKKNYKVIQFPNTEEKVAIVLLSSEDFIDAKVKTEQYCNEKGITDDTYIEIEHQIQIVYKALRDKDDISKKLADSIDEIRSLRVDEISYIMTEYNQFQMEVSPLLNAINEEQFEELKKTLGKMSWKDLNGESLLALRNFLMSLV